ncbi:MAG: TetR/AcrR family transcriptional regulator [Acidobacteria bacterium]|nr:TetR/AcrR family transcriptional regulator [Acidobacteriota bacterium]
MSAKSTRDPERTREAILSAAERLIAQKGFQAFTLDEVAQGAAVSKGGVLHHYPNKHALLAGLAQQMLQQEEAEIEEFLRQDPKAPGAYTRAFLRTHLSYMDEGCSRVCAELFYEMRNVPGMQERIGAHVRKTEERLENDGLDPVVASIISHAASGLMSGFIWGIPRAKKFDDVVARLVEMAGGESSSV